MQRIVIVGGGFAGVGVARALARMNKKKQWEIVLVDEEGVHVYTPWLYKIATALESVYAKKVRDARFARVSCALEDIFRKHHVRIVKERVTAVARDGSWIAYGKDSVLRADVLVLAQGAEMNDFGIAGVKKYAHVMKTPRAAQDIARHLEDVYEDVRLGRSKRATIAIVGAGATGCEFASELALVTERFCKKYAVRRGQFRIVVCDANSMPGSMFHPKVSAHIAKRLRALGVEFFAKTPVEDIGAGELHARGVSLPYDVLVWSAGVRARADAQAWKLPVNARGRIMVEDTGQVVGMSHVFALGDTAARAHADPQSAQVATFHAKKIAKNIQAFLMGNPLVPCKTRSWHVVLALGGRFAVGQVGVICTGTGAYILRKAIDLAYVLRVFPLARRRISWYADAEK